MDVHAHEHPKGFLDRLAADERTGRVIVHLRGGTSLTGRIGETSNESVVIKALTGREFYDAWVRMDAITCIEVQTRS